METQNDDSIIRLIESTEVAMHNLAQEFEHGPTTIAEIVEANERDFGKKIDYEEPMTDAERHRHWCILSQLAEPRRIPKIWRARSGPTASHGKGFAAVYNRMFDLPDMSS